jgi:hypothetical protein
MPEQTAGYIPDLRGELKAYFAMTTTTELPRGVRDMSARTLGRRRRVATMLLATSGGFLATAALVAGIVALHHGTLGAGSARFSSAAANAGNATPGAAAIGPATISYPGVDTDALANAGALLLLPAGHGNAQLTPSQAAAIAVAAQSSSTAPGPAVLAWVELTGTSPPNTCLCWVVDIPPGVGGNAGTGSGPAAPPQALGVLVLVDAISGHVFDTLPAPASP